MFRPQAQSQPYSIENLTESLLWFILAIANLNIHHFHDLLKYLTTIVYSIGDLWLCKDALYDFKI